MAYKMDGHLIKLFVHEIRLLVTILILSNPLLYLLSMSVPLQLVVINIHLLEFLCGVVVHIKVLFQVPHN